MDDLETRPAAPRVVGIRYRPDEGLPQVILKGVGPLADELLRRRGERRVPPVVRNPSLVDALYRLPVDAQIGPELFHAVAAFLAHVLSVDAKLAQENGVPHG
jgi:type III secretion system FlhB-like substrate exporter